MTRWRYQVDVDRVILHGVSVERIDSADLRALVEQAVARALVDAPLPAGRTMRTSVQITAGSAPKAGVAGVAAAIASGVAQAANGGPRRG